MTDKDTEKQDMPTTQPASVYRKLAESALFITACTCAAYIIGWSYADAYFERLSIHHESLNLPPIYYIREAFLPVFLFGFLVWWSLKDSHSPPRTRLTAFRHNLLGFVFVALGLHYAVIMFPKWVAYLLFLSCLSFLFVLVPMSLKKKSFPSMLSKSVFPSRVFGVLFLFSLLLVFARFMGRLHAQKYAEGTLHNVIAVQLYLKPASRLRLPKEEFLLVLHANGCYYVVEKQVHLPEYPTVYIVPESEVLGAICRRIN